MVAANALTQGSHGSANLRRSISSWKLKNNAPSHIIIIIIVSANLDWIPQRRASAVCFQCWISSRLAATPYGIEEPPLRRTIRRRQACARAVLSDR